ncbi:hypothetical protein UMM65_08070 [Aureibaculum sp. 2210JD6-5]|uniref:hypothetical protein n=1 Tax=Aureibaculum sp. 2210JD6-5 TaxID=3103957 RepID=UPI002AAEC5B0|nr:hypothetical protein [Aureibaculum sp. 2210JD6-5]MDY7395195.1 hypothetical protein [Aureibaculum sp. 2210JD6-5]
MRPLILEFQENPNYIEFDESLFEYSENKNLSVMRGTDIPAISYLNMGTETHTRVNNEVSDSDSVLKTLMGTETFTKVLNENTDSDDDFRMLMGTETHTFVSNEPTDSDMNSQSLKLLMATQSVDNP